MKYGKRTLSLLLALALMAALVTTAMASGDTRIWLSTTEDDENGTVTAFIVTDGIVTDGLIELSYDSSVLTYQDIEVSDACVAKYAVNAGDGVVKISWVAPGAYQNDGTAELIRVNFTGTDGSSLKLSGTAYDAAGTLISLTVLDTSALEAAIEKAAGLNAEDYTADSYKAVETALDQAYAVLNDSGCSQEEVDAAAAALNAAIDALVKDSTQEPTQESTQVPSTEDATQPTASQPAGDNSHTGDQSPIVTIIGVMAICAVGIVAVCIIMKKRGSAE